MAMDLWTLFVEHVFGGFWISVVGLMAMMYIILLVGGTSQKTTLSYLSIFLLAMALGYGFSAVQIILTIGIIYWNIIALPRMINSGSQ